MTGVPADYRRPGLSTVTVVQDCDEVRDVLGLIESTIPFVEEMVVLFLGVAPQLPENIDGGRVRVASVPAGAWGGPTRTERALSDAAQLASHEFNVWLPAHVRLSADHWADLRARVARLGDDVLSFRAPGERREYATYYRQLVWRSAWGLRPTPSGHLVGISDGKLTPRGTIVLDDLGNIDKPFDASDALRKLRPLHSATCHVAVAGSPRSGGVPVTRLLHAAGMVAGDELLVSSTRESIWEDRLVREANAQLVRDASGQTPTWVAGATVNADPSRLSETAFGLLPSAVSRLDDSRRWVFKDALFSSTLPAWKAHLGDLGCIVPVRDPREIAASLRVKHWLSPVDTVRWWRQHYEQLIRHLLELDVPALFVDFGALRETPKVFAERVTGALGLQAPKTDSWFESGRAGQSHPGDLREDLASWVGDEALPGEVDATCALADSLFGFARQNEPLSTSPLPALQDSVTALLQHRGSDAELEASLRALEASSRASNIDEVIVLDEVGASASSLESCRLEVRIEQASAQPSTHLRDAVRSARGRVLWFSRTDVHVTSSCIADHLEAQADDVPRVVVGAVAGTDSSWPDDLALIGRASIDEAEALLGGPFLMNTSVNRAAIDRVGEFDTTLSAGFEFVDFAIRAHSRGIEIQTSEAARVVASRPATAAAIAEQERGSGKALLDFVEKRPAYFSRDLLRKRVWESGPLLDQHGVLLDELTKLEQAYGPGKPPEDVANQVELARRQLALSSSVLGLTRRDPRVIRLLGRDLWYRHVMKRGERWGDPSDGQVREQMDVNRERVLALQGKYAGATAFVCGTSPQLADLSNEQVRSMQEHLVVGVNDSFYRVRPHVALSAYFNRVAFARQVLGDSAEVIHMRPFLAPPLVDGILTVRRALFQGALPLQFGNDPTVLTYNNVVLGATHLALLLGARRIVYVGLELKSQRHYYTSDEGLKRSLVADFDEIVEDRFFGVDHEYERHANLTNGFFQKSAEALASYPDPFVDFDVVSSFARYFDTMKTMGIEFASTIEGNALTSAGAPFVALDGVLRGEMTEALAGATS